MATKIRRSLTLPTVDVERVAASSTTASRAIREALERFLKNGSKCTPTEYTKVQMFIDPEVFEQAQEKALKENGMPLHQVIAFEIARMK